MAEQNNDINDSQEAFDDYDYGQFDIDFGEEEMY